MADRTVNPSNSGLSEEHMDLLQTSLSQDGRQEVERNVQDFLAEEMQKWRESIPRFEQSEDADGKDFAEKNLVLFTALMRLVRPVLLTYTQQWAVGEMIHCEAADRKLHQLLHPGDATRSMLAVATYISVAGRS